ncbi:MULTISPECIES: hypothetical protein [Haloferax]|uniref:Uncharacterized protein n=2 Tax=Haloferax TaxID=2251 RepID=A0A6G1Z0L8_9EURY|nr:MULTISPECIES: hypothetical protein [Haloferax]KAB1187534.1 hypothetical protein Hfx1149_05600 [Haloferax sp. CBA1149]MRW80187.1 hypothetical protein [Haloferax marinisediminis]
MVGLGTQSVTERKVSFAWVGMAVLMSLAVAGITYLGLPIETVYVFAVGVTVREIIEVAVWTVAD